MKFNRKERREHKEAFRMNTKTILCALCVLCG